MIRACPVTALPQQVTHERAAWQGLATSGNRGTLAEGALTSHDCCSSAVLPPAPAPPLPPAFLCRPDPLLPLAPAAGSPSAAVVLPPAVAFTVPLVVPFAAADGGGGGGFGCVRRVHECQLQAQGHVTEPCGNKLVLRFHATGIARSAGSNVTPGCCSCTAPEKTRCTSQLHS